MEVSFIMDATPHQYAPREGDGNDILPHIFTENFLTIVLLFLKMYQKSIFRVFWQLSKTKIVIIIPLSGSRATKPLGRNF